MKHEFEIWLSSDEEGNSYSPMFAKSKVSIGVKGTKVIFFPSPYTVTDLTNAKATP
jgi:hypothetical protein